MGDEILKVMIADDEERICQLIEALIDCDALHMEVVGVAHNGLEACDLVKERKPDILITDIRMPGYSGLELIEKIKGNEEDLEIIIISGYAHFAYAQTAIKFGVGDYLLKPINREELTGTLQKLGSRIRERRQRAIDHQRIQQKSEADIRLFRTNLLNRLTEENAWRPSVEELREIVYSAAGLFLSQVEVKNRADAIKDFEEGCSLCGSIDGLFERLCSLQRAYVEEMKGRHEADTVRPIRMAKQYIQNHYSEPITQEEVSSAVGLSAAYFSALFKKVEGEGFAKYLIGVRIEQAKVLLRETNIPVSRICQQVGYNDLKHFTHTFEKATGVKPTVYRKMYG